MLEFFNSKKYILLSFKKSYDVISSRLYFEKNKNKKIVIKLSTIYQQIF